MKLASQAQDGIAQLRRRVSEIERQPPGRPKYTDIFSYWVCQKGLRYWFYEEEQLQHVFFLGETDKFEGT